MLASLWRSSQQAETLVQSLASTKLHSYTLRCFKYSPNTHIFSHSEAACFEYPVKPHSHLQTFAWTHWGCDRPLAGAVWLPSHAASQSATQTKAVCAVTISRSCLFPWSAPDLELTSFARGLSIL